MGGNPAKLVFVYMSCPTVCLFYLSSIEEINVTAAVRAPQGKESEVNHKSKRRATHRGCVLCLVW